VASTRGEDFASLEGWMEQATKSGLPEFENFVATLRKDEAAVRAAASTAWLK
jgi:transposase